MWAFEGDQRLKYGVGTIEEKYKFKA